jgi:hypothetical protein
VPEEITLNKVFRNTPEGRRAVGKARWKWLDDVENDPKKMCGRGWRKNN